MNRFNRDDFEDESENEPKKKRFNIFNRAFADGKGVEKDELRVLEDPSLINFFKLFGRKLSRLFSINLLYIFGNFPILFFLFYMGKFTQIETAAPAYSVYSSVYGAAVASPSPVTASLLGIFGRTSTVYIDTPLSKVFLVLSFLILFTFGPVNVGCTHLIRSMIREEPVFFWSDIFYAIKKNFRQGMIFGIIDCVLCFMIAYNIIWYNANASVNTMMLLFLFMTWGMLVLYGMMRMYIYLMMITFDLSLPKLLKNAVFFAALGIKRNLLAVLGIVIMIALVYTLASFYLPFAMIIIATLFFSSSALMGAYAAYPKIKEVMIDPYYDSDGNPKPSSENASARS